MCGCVDAGMPPVHCLQNVCCNYVKRIKTVIAESVLFTGPRVVVTVTYTIRVIRRATAVVSLQIKESILSVGYNVRKTTTKK